jgi:hypothetical protein
MHSVFFINILKEISMHKSCCDAAETAHRCDAHYVLHPGSSRDCRAQQLQGKSCIKILFSKETVQKNGLMLVMRWLNSQMNGK